MSLSEHQEFLMTSPEFISETPESIYQPGCIQPYGMLLVLQEPELSILQVSENSGDFFARSPESLLNKNLAELFDETQVETLKLSLNRDNLQSLNPVKLISRSNKHRQVFDGIIHRHQNLLILELEPALELKFNFFDFYHLVKQSSSKLQQTSTLQDLTQTAAKEVRQLIGFDRVVVYRFNQENNGEVIAEDKQDDLEPWLGLNYPALDIPEAVREIFSQIWVRFIPDIDYRAVRIVPEYHPLDRQPLNLSLSALRSVSPCHLEYLRNIGARATLTLSLIKDKKLWGLIACHHQSTKKLPYEMRVACEFLAQTMSLEISAKVETEDYEYKLKLKNIQAQLLEYMTTEPKFIEGLVKYKPNVLDLVNAQSAALCLDEEMRCFGNTPEQSELEKLIQWLETDIFTEDNRVFHTHSLAKHYPASIDYKDIASGLLAIAVSRSQKKYILWFRPEVIQTVNWAGNPNHSFKVEKEGKLVLCPRTSFELWKEQVRLQSLPWKNCEIEAALALRNAIIGIVLKKADELAKLNVALQESETRERDKSTQLESMIEQLKRTQTQLIQSEKMSSLGQLVAGVAHEINNPVNFIYGNLAHADCYTQDLINLINLYTQHYPSPDPEIQQESEAIDLEFLIEDLPKLLASMQVGADRIREIVQSLRNFSRLDESEMKRVDIHEGLDSTLLILSNRLKYRVDRPSIQVIKNYGKLPLIECYAGQLNQVFMNILANAIDVLEEYNRDRTLEQVQANPSTITISTELRTQNSSLATPSVVIRIVDNGPGIPEEVKSQLFDPFFTTKPVGKGTGIGLAISYQIVVEKHEGLLTCNSISEQGAEFVIEIPIKAVKERSPLT